MSAKLHPLSVTVSRSRWRYFSIALSAALHTVLLASLIGLWTRLGGNQFNTMDIDLVMITDGSDSYAKSPTPDNRSNDTTPTASAAAGTPAQQAAAPALPAAPVQIAPPAATAAPVTPTQALPPPSPVPPAQGATAAVIVLPPPSPIIEPVKPLPQPARAEPPAPTPVPAPPKPVPPVAKQLPAKAPVQAGPPAGGIDNQAPAPSSTANGQPTPAPVGGAGSNRGGASAGEVALLSSPAPAYPSDARERGQEGRVLVRTKVLPDGVPQNVTVETSSGVSSLDAAAVDAVRNWRFRNTTGGPIDVTVPVRFTLSEAPISTVASTPVVPPSPAPSPLVRPLAPSPPSGAPSPVAPAATPGTPSSGTSGEGSSSSIGSTGRTGAGTGGSAGSGQVAVLDAPAPNYPPESRSRGEEGRVIVSAQIGTDGQPRNVAVFTSSGSAQLDQAAVEAVRKWRFSNRSGHAVDMTVPIRFVLRPEN